MSATAQVAVIQFPGVNCEDESVRALERVGLGASVFRWTRPVRELERFDAFVLPGGWSYQDRVRAGALAAKHPLVDALGDEARRGKPVLGICNGAQVLVEAGLVPGESAVEVALARNRMPERAGYYARWVHVRVEAGPCLFTRTLAAGTVLPLPVAHGEGRFTSIAPGGIARWAESGQAPLRYCAADGGPARGFPDNPNGAAEDVAALCNARGNVLAMMPHPERAADLGQVARDVGGAWGGRREALFERATAVEERIGAAGPGLALFEGLASWLAEVRT